VEVSFGGKGGGGNCSKIVFHEKDHSMQRRSEKVTNRVWESQAEEKVQKGSIDETV
jgi:hypothetical protein